MKVKNLKGTSDKKCKCSSWLEHYKTFSEKDGKKCCCCGKNADVGAHIQKNNDSNSYIVPLCYACNKKDEIFEINLSVNDLVSANVKLTCGK